MRIRRMFSFYVSIKLSARSRLLCLPYFNVEENPPEMLFLSPIDLVGELLTELPTLGCCSLSSSLDKRYSSSSNAQDRPPLTEVVLLRSLFVLWLLVNGLRGIFIGRFPLLVANSGELSTMLLLFLKVKLSCFMSSCYCLSLTLFLGAPIVVSCSLSFLISSAYSLIKVSFGSSLIFG